MLYVSLGYVPGQLGWTSWGEGFILLYVNWFIPIHTTMSYPLGTGHSSGGECKGYCIGSFYNVINTLHESKTP